MYYYQILAEKRLPRLLTYSSSRRLSRGVVVEVPLRNKPVWGVVIKEAEGDFSEIKNIKEIKRIYPVSLSEKQMSFLFSFAYNTFNSKNMALSAALNPIQLLAEKYWKQFEKALSEAPVKAEERFAEENGQRKDSNISFYLENNPTFRIRDIIRSKISNLKKVGNSNTDNESNSGDQFLIIFPEQKLLNRIHKEIVKELKKENLLDFVNLFVYSGTPNKNSRETVIGLLEQKMGISRKSCDNQENPLLCDKITVVFSTRNGLFLPFQSLKQIVLVDEANSFYIQDQNSLYYDARDAAFLLSRSSGADLTFIGNTPSVRLYNFYSEEVLKQFSSNYEGGNQKPLKIKIRKRERSFTFNNLFSESILEDIGVEYEE